MPVETTGQSEGVSVSVPLSRARAASVSSLGASALGSSVCLEPHADTAEKFDLVKKSSRQNGVFPFRYGGLHFIFMPRQMQSQSLIIRKGDVSIVAATHAVSGQDYAVDETGATGVLMRHMEKDNKKAYAELFNQSSIGKKRAAAASQTDIRSAFGFGFVYSSSYSTHFFYPKFAS